MRAHAAVKLGEILGVPRRSILSLRLALVAAALFFASLLFDWPVASLVLKPIPVVCVLAWVARVASRDAQLVALGLVLSLVGDVCLTSVVDLFIPGLVAFLLAHVAYVVAYVRRTRALHLLRLVPVAAFGAFAFHWLAPSLGEMRGPVLVYVVVICAMMWRAAAQIGERPGAEGHAWAALIGAVMFAVSDTMVAYNRFVAPSLAVEIALMILYWGAQGMIAASVERERSA